MEDKETDLVKRRYLLLAMILLFIMGIALSGDSRVEAADQENCLMCHKYPDLAWTGADGHVKNFNINEHIFLNSLHGQVACRGCHSYIKKFPHDPVTQKVNCGNVCHIRPPWAEENFSHKKIIGIFNSSIHAIKPDESALMKKSDPVCKYCHLNPLYKRVPEKTISFGKTLDRCLNCHHRKGVTLAYRHIMHRLRRKTSRSSQQIVALCAGCHGNVPLMKKLGLPERALAAVSTYEESIHGQMVTLGSEKAADCINCHASSLLHDIYKPDNPKSSINEKNLQTTCKNCHKKINKYFIKIAVHPSLEDPHNPFLFVLNNFVLRLLLYSTVFGLMTLLLGETFRRERDGANMKLKSGTSWRKKKKRNDEKRHIEEPK
jgi:5-methylcytosine-specific restriction endonuclease McrA